MVRDLGEFPRPVLAALAAAERVLSRRVRRGRRAGRSGGPGRQRPLGRGPGPGGPQPVLAAAHPRRQALPGRSAPGPARPVPLRGGQLPAVHRAARRRPAQPGADRPRPAEPAAGAGGPRPQLDAGRQAVRPRPGVGAALPAQLGPGAGPDAGGRPPAARATSVRCCAGRGSGPGGTRWPRTPARRWPACPTCCASELGVDVSAAAVAGGARAPPGCSAAPATGRSARPTPARTTTW